MTEQTVIKKTIQILNQERAHPTIGYALLDGGPQLEMTALMIHLGLSQVQRQSGERQTVFDKPGKFPLASENFDLLCSLWDRTAIDLQAKISEVLLNKLTSQDNYRNGNNDPMSVGSWRSSISEMPLVVEFLIRRCDKASFFEALAKPAFTPGLSLLLLDLEQAVALDFTMFTEDEYEQLSSVVCEIAASVPVVTGAISPIALATAQRVDLEVPYFCAAVAEVCRRAVFQYLKVELTPGLNLEVNQDKVVVRTFLTTLGFSKDLVGSLDEAEKLYRSAETAFDKKSALGHLRSFLENLYLEACKAVHKMTTAPEPPKKWGAALEYLTKNTKIQTKQEELFTAHFYTLMSDTGVHPLIAETEYTRLMRNMTIEMALLFLTKFHKAGLSVNKKQNP